MNEFYAPENFEKNNFDRKQSKKLSQNEIWKENIIYQKKNLMIYIKYF